MVSQPTATFAQIPLNREQPDQTLDSKTRAQVIEAVIQALDEYIFPEIAQKVQADIRSRLQGGTYNGITSSKKFAETLTNHIQEISRDKHLRVFYSYTPFPQVGGREQKLTPEEQEKFRQSVAKQNFGFHKVERLAGNIGYLDLRGFLSPEAAGETAIAAMNFLSHTDALIIDLRQNGGGSPDMVALISTYLFDDKPVHLNNLHWREPTAAGTFQERVEQHWTLPYVPGKRYLNKPVYVLTSSFTFSAAEEFTNNLKYLKRATIIGETTGGGANPGRFQPLNNHFGLFVPTGRAVNPMTQTNWEGTGVKPDVKVSAEQALKTAHLAALKEVLAKATDPELMDELKQAISTVKE
ncbi:MAG: S41 family peptidase [Myxacorys californica WJT36-NPBG1]|jgi:C-terminal processing protease CtpA/Prc|nr:S41 family peptidase [Myxacorys californica WJT36-NPBG1]